MKKIAILSFIGLLGLILSGCTTTNEQSHPSSNQDSNSIPPIITTEENDVLIAYFSRIGESYNGEMIEVGNIDQFTSYLTDLLEGETTFKINPETAYPVSYDEMLSVAQEEWSSNARPEIANLISSIDEYETIMIGYPIWNGHAPRIIYSFLDAFDFSNKRIIPFATAGSSSMNNSVNELESNYPNYQFEEGLRITDSTIQNEQESKNLISTWLEELF